MSQLNIKGLVKNIRTRANVYTPIVEAVVNSIQAIGDSGRKDGKIIIKLERSNQKTLDSDNSSLAEIANIEVQDNGIGFNEINRNSFDTLYSNLKIEKGGKGFGRFMFLKYFDSVSVKSIFKDGNKYSHRFFIFGKNEEIIENENITKSDKKDTQTILYLKNLQDGKLDKKLETISRKLLEKLLIYFINDNYVCPKISLKENEKNEEIVLNDYLHSDDYPEIKQVASKNFTLEHEEKAETFQVKIFKIFYPNNQRSKISLVAHNREVIETPLHCYVPEFEDDFYEEFENENGEKIKKDYMIRAYVLGDYLDRHVLQERDAFDFSDQNELFHPFSKEDIEVKTAEITKEIFKNEVKTRKNKKKKRINEYVAKAPWYRAYIEDLDISSIPYIFSDEDIELELHKAKFQQEINAKAEAKKIIENPDIKIDKSVEKLIKKISKAEMSDLARYVALRKTILGIFKKSLAIKDNGEYSSENIMHNIIFPTRADSNSTSYNSHNLWIIDEKLNFTKYISSDQPLNGGTSKRADLLVYNNQIVFRGDNEASNPITIFEFKKPQRDTFADPSASKKEDPIYQIIQYVNDIKDGKYKTPEGRDISIGNNTPFYGFVVCDLTKKVKDWLLKENDFKEMPDGQGWFRWFDYNNLYMEVISWDKMLKDAEMRNKIFFHKLGL